MEAAGPPMIELQQGFDPCPSVHSHVLELRRPDERTVRYIDEGRAGWRSIVFFGGVGTSVGVFFLTEFARTLREQLRLRAFSVERNGNRGAVTDDVLAVLAEAGVERFAIIAFSGGAQFAAALAARVPERIESLHLAAASAGVEAGLSAPPDPATMWQYPPGSPVNLIPGFVREAAEEGHHPDRLDYEWRLLSTEPLPDLSAVTAPVYLYWGTADDIVTPAHAEAWQRALPNVVAERRYQGEAHDIQYRHWDQILVDAAGLGAWIVVCSDGRTELAAPGQAAGATLGICAWEAVAG